MGRVASVVSDTEGAERGRRGGGRGGGTGRRVDQVVRRHTFEAAHPEVTISYLGAGRPWAAVIALPGAAEERVTAYELEELLDRLEARREGGTE
jgi:hypothetical protein